MARISSRRHARFYGTLAIGLAVTAISTPLKLNDRVLIGADVFFALYLLGMWYWARNLTGRALHRHFADADEGVTLIVFLALGVICVTFYAIFDVLRQVPGTMDGAGLVRPPLALVSIPLGWALVHTVMTFHYARLYYGRGPRREDQRTGGLEFPGGTTEPGVWDFLYYSFTVGMTAQTSDAAVTTTRMRKATLGHAVLSFFYNAVILALAVNAGLALGQ